MKQGKAQQDTSGRDVTASIEAMGRSEETLTRSDIPTIMQDIMRQLQPTSYEVTPPPLLVQSKISSVFQGCGVPEGDMWLVTNMDWGIWY